MNKLINRKKKKGFTLIELIVVIAILGILAAILVPSMLGIIGDANTKVDTANARSAYSAALVAATKLSAADTALTITNVHDDAVATLGAALPGTFVVALNAAGDGVASITYSPPAASGRADVIIP